MALSRQELNEATGRSVDPNGFGLTRRHGHNRHLSDAEIQRRIADRNRRGQPTHLLRQEYEGRLQDRGQ